MIFEGGIKGEEVKNFIKFFIVLFLFLNLANLNFLHADEKPASKAKRSWREYFGLSSKGKKSSFERPEKVREADSEAGELSPEGMADLIDSQTQNVIDYGAYRLNFRLYSKGGILGHLSFGVFRRLNIGASWDIEQALGSENPTANVPALNVKFRVYDGGEVLPAVAAGYDGQGRFFNKTTDDYQERERGLYLALGREVFFPKLEAYGGANIAKFKDGEVFGSVGLSYAIEDRVVLMTEYDNIRAGPDNRWNAGIRVFPIPSLGIDFAFRRIASSQDKERIIRINYVGSF